jgi:hypothetical protein
MYAKVIGPNLFKTSRTQRLKIILQLQNFCSRDAPTRARGRRAQSHTTPRPPRCAALAPTRSRSERPHAYTTAAATIATAPCMVYMAAKRGARAAWLGVRAGAVGGVWCLVRQINSEDNFDPPCRRPTRWILPEVLRATVEMKVRFTGLAQIARLGPARAADGYRTCICETITSSLS